MHEVRFAVKVDHLQMGEIEKRCFRHPWSVKAFDEFAENGGVILVAGAPGTVLGHILVSFAADEGAIAKLGVDPSVWRQGVASALFRQLEKEAAKRGVTKLFLEVRVSNAGAIALYEKTGFKAVGRRRGFYQDPLEDAIVYRKDLV